jgi:hypothetical protein
VTALSPALFGVLLAQLVLGVLPGCWCSPVVRNRISARRCRVPARLPVLWAKLLVLAGLVLPAALGCVAEFFVATAVQSARGGQDLAERPGRARALWRGAPARSPLVG